MKREFLTTQDGSVTIHLPDWNEQYHSIHGAINEAKHVFLKHGLEFFVSSEANIDQPVAILEIGFGTGLNALLTFLFAETNGAKIHYMGVEAYPVEASEIRQLNYSELLKIPSEVFMQLHDTPWEASNAITKTFTLIKRKQFFSEIKDKEAFHIIYFDAFGARVQPELWTEAVFKTMYDALRTNGVLVTYSAKGSVRRAMQAVGFTVERLPGPPGKREMLRALKRG
ncbi:MAG: tRNA (5-methylaminomethyl-2-thiouridine)(34)-methyltransferase MnmD [Bacteroidota bacterium]